MTDLSVNTSRFGDIQVNPELAIDFVEPILGFPESTRFVLLDHAEDSPFKWLQSMQEPDLAFVVTNPRFFGIDFTFELADEYVRRLSLKAAEDTLVLTIVNIPSGNPALMTTNLLGPIIINQVTRQAIQAVLTDSKFSTKARLLPDEKLEAAQGGKAARATGE